jgi:Icc protein
MHHPPLEVGSEFIDILGLRNPKEFWSLMEGHQNVNGLIFGHVHQVFETKIGGKECLSVPSTAMQFKPNSKELDFDELPYGYRILSLHAK